jgi:transcriptional regulator with XRE-family HTH domain
MNNYITGKIIKELREKQGITQSSLADKIGVSDKTVSKWKRAKGFPISRL